MQAGKTKMTKRLGVAVIAAAAALTLTACGSSSDTATSSTTSAAATSAAATSKASSAASGSAAPGSGEASLAPVPEGDTVAVTLITKDSINPFFIAMQEGAKAAAEKDNVELTIAAGKADGDEDGQIQAIENAISRGDQGILITPERSGGQSGDCQGAGRGAVRHRVGHPARPGGHRRHHLRHRQLQGR